MLKPLNFGWLEELAHSGDTVPASAFACFATVSCCFLPVPGLLCDHGLMCRVRAACLVDRKAHPGLPVFWAEGCLARLFGYHLLLCVEVPISVAQFASKGPQFRPTNEQLRTS